MQTPEGYEEGTYLHEFTEAAPESGSDAPESRSNTKAIVVGTGVGVFTTGASVIVGGLALLIALAAFPIGLCISIPLFIVVAYLIGGVGGAVAQVAGGNAPASSRRLPNGLWGECPYCGHPRGAKRKEGDRLACGRCLNTFVIRGDRFYIPEDRLKKFRKKIPAPTVEADQHLPPT